MQITTYLTFNGNCREAFQMYERVLGGKIIFMMTNGESPMAEQMSPAAKDRIMHATLSIPGGGAINGADHPENKAAKLSGFSVSVTVKDKAEGERIFAGLCDGGEMRMAFQQTFWSPGFGMCVDQFGVPWMVNTEGQMAA